MENKLQDPKKIKFNGAKVIFHTGPEDEKAEEFGTSITIELTPEMKKELEAFAKENNVGKNGDPSKGKANIKQYTNEETGVTTDQFTVKYTEHTKFAGINGLTQNDLGYGSVVNLIANAYEYKKFGGGVAISASAVVITKGAASSNDGDLDELLGELGDETDTDASDVPF